MHQTSEVIAAMAEVLPVNFEGIPQELQSLHQWVVWNYHEINGLLKKPPFTPASEERADITDPATWGSFEEARDAYTTKGYAGIGIALTQGLVAFDFDDCIKKGIIDPRVEKLIRYLGTRFEISPGRKGVRGFLFGHLPGSQRRRGKVEVYHDKRYVTVTGRHIPFSSPQIAANQTRLNRVYGIIFPNRAAGAAPQEVASTRQFSIDESIKYALDNAGNRDLFRRLYYGDASLWGRNRRYPSKSEADFALVRLIIFWIGTDRQKIDMVFRQSGLYDEKWDESRGIDGQGRAKTYGSVTIDNALIGARVRKGLHSNR